MRMENRVEVESAARRAPMQPRATPLALGRVKTWGAAVLLLAPLASAQNSQSAPQTESETLPLTEPASRDEIMQLLSQVQDELDAIPEGERNASSPRYVELRTQLELLLLQAELERIRDENEALQAQLSDAPAQAGGGLSGEVAAQLGQMEERLQNYDQQLSVVMEQHAEILGAAAAAPEEAAATESAGVEGTGTQSYTIEPGDTLSHIALEAYGTPYRWPEIFDANPILTDPHLLPVGTVLLIP